MCDIVSYVFCVGLHSACDNDCVRCVLLDCIVCVIMTVLGMLCLVLMTVLSACCVGFNDCVKCMLCGF